MLVDFWRKQDKDGLILDDHKKSIDAGYEDGIVLYKLCKIWETEGD